MIDDDLKEYAKILVMILELEKWKNTQEQKILKWLEKNGQDVIGTADGTFFAQTETVWEYSQDIAVLEDMIVQAKEDEVDRGAANGVSKTVLKFKPKK